MTKNRSIRLTYPNPRIDKSKLIGTMTALIDSGHLIAGQQQINHQSPSNDQMGFRGDLTGCLILAINQITTDEDVSPYSKNHHFVAIELGFPVELITSARLIFEKLPEKNGPEWVLKLLQAIPETTDLAPALPQIIKRILTAIALPTIQTDNQEAINITTKVIEDLDSDVENTTQETVFRMAIKSYREARDAMETTQKHARKLRATGHALIAASQAFEPKNIEHVMNHTALAADDARKPNPYIKMAKILLNEMSRLTPTPTTPRINNTTTIKSNTPTKPRKLQA